MTALGNIPVTADVTATNDIFPPGVMMHWSGVNADIPAGWLPCAGQSLLRVGTYAALFAAIDTAYGSIDANSFNVPDLRGRVYVGSDNMGVGAANRIALAVRGNSGGVEKVAITDAHMPWHGHNISGMLQNASHRHGIKHETQAYYGDNLTKAAPGGGNLSDLFGLDDCGAACDHEHGMNADGGNGAHNNMQPFIVVLSIIKI